PMRARRPETRFAMLSTAWSRTDPFWRAWDSDDSSWIRLKATADTIHYDPDFLEQERRALGEEGFKREYLGIPVGGQASPFTWDLYERATQPRNPLVPPGPAFGPPLIAHDVGRSRDRSTAVVGGNSPFQPRLLGIKDLEELPQGHYGSAR